MFLNLDKYVEEFSNQPLYYKFLFIGVALGLFFSFLWVNMFIEELINYFVLVRLFNSTSYFSAVYPLILGVIGLWFSYNNIKKKSKGLNLGISIIIIAIIWFFISNCLRFIGQFPISYLTRVYPFILSIIGLYFSKKHFKSGIFIVIFSLILMINFMLILIPFDFILISFTFLIGGSLLIFLLIPFIKRNLESCAIAFIITSLFPVLIYILGIILYNADYVEAYISLLISTFLFFIIPCIFITIGSILMLKNSSKVHISEIISI